MEKPPIQMVFDLLDRWRHYPAYQLERRADIFFSIFLKEILECKFKEKIDSIFPEFPVLVDRAKGSEEIANFRTIKIDYVAICQEKRKVYAIELKTDVNSHSELQVSHMKNIEKLSFNKLLCDLRSISEKSRSKQKYLNFISDIEKVWNSKNEKDCESMIEGDIAAVYILPSAKNVSNVVITFDDIILVLKHRNDELAKRFVESLHEWKESPAKLINNY